MTGRTNAAGGVRLPELVNPAGAAQILSGYEAINADGEAMVGTLVVQEPVYGIYNDPAQHVNISNSGGDLGSLQITLPETVDRLLGLCVIGWASNGDSVLLCYPASSSYSDFPDFPASPAEDCGWGLYYSGQIETKVETSGAVVTITNNGMSCPALSEIQQVAYTYIPA